MFQRYQFSHFLQNLFFTFLQKKYNKLIIKLLLPPHRLILPTFWKTHSGGVNFGKSG